MTLLEELQPFFDYMELDPIKARIIIRELEEQEHINTRQQLFLLEGKSWKHIAMMDVVVRDALEAWINDDLQPIPQIDDITLDRIVEPIGERVSWSTEKCVDHVILLSNLGISKFKHLRPLKKGTLYRTGLPVLLIQELKAQTKTVLNSARYQASGPVYKLPIVGEKVIETMSPDIISGLAKFAIKDERRMVRQIEGLSYEYDRKCPHKGADLTYVRLHSIPYFYSLGPYRRRYFDLPKAQMEV